MQASFAAVVAAIVLACAESCLAADETPVDLELVLAVDISASMTPDEQQFQRQGYVQALRSPRVLNAIRSGALGRIAVAYVEWADEGIQRVVVPWTIVDGEDSALDFSNALEGAPIGREFGTSISAALRFSNDQFSVNNYVGERRAVDVSGDGPNNLGPSVEATRDEVVGDGVTINALPIMIRPRWGQGLYSIEGLDHYFEDCVIGGPGAFVVSVDRKEDFGSAIERKLVLEISNGIEATIVPVAEFRREERIDCMSGEKGEGRLSPAN